MPLFRLLLLAVVAVSASSCASLKPGDVPETPQPADVAAADPVAEEAVPSKAAALDPDLMLSLLLGEVAGQRGDLPTAIQAYVKAAQASGDPEVAGRAVQIALYGKDFSSAKKALEVLLEAEPENPSVHQLAMGVYLRERNAEMALFHALAVVRLSNSSQRATLLALANYLVRDSDPGVSLKLLHGMVGQVADKSGAYHALAVVERHSNLIEQAETSVRQAIQLDPDWALPYVLLASIYDHSNRSEEALAVLQQASTRFSDRALLMAYGQMLAKSNQLDAAAKQFDRLLQQEPGFHSARMALALVLIQQEKLEQAREQLLELVEVPQFQEQSVYYLGRIARWNEQPKQAIDWFSQIEQGSLYVDAQTNIAVLKAQTGQVDAAREILRDLREWMPEQASRFYILEGEILHTAEDFAAFYELMNAAVEQFPDDMKVRYSRALAAVEVGHLEILESDLRLVLSRDPNDVDALNALGFSLAAETERFSEAATLLEKAIQLRPDDPAILDSVGWLRYRQGQYELALEFLQRAYEKFPDDEIAAHLGEVLWALGRKDEARKLWRVAGKNHPGSRHLRDVLERFE